MQVEDKVLELLVALGVLATKNRILQAGKERFRHFLLTMLNHLDVNNKRNSPSTELSSVAAAAAESVNA
jgi:hypothetical protein